MTAVCAMDQQPLSSLRCGLAEGRAESRAEERGTVGPESGRVWG